MNDTGCIALVDTTRDELRERIGEARQRFYRLARSANPHARNEDWIGPSIRSSPTYSASRAAIRRSRRDGTSAVPATHASSIMVTRRCWRRWRQSPNCLTNSWLSNPVMDVFFDGMPDDYAVEFHCGAMVSGVVAQVTWLFELVLHGEDIARSVGVPWEIGSATCCSCFARGWSWRPHTSVRRSADPPPTSASVYIFRRHDHTWCMFMTASRNRARAVRVTGRTPF